MAAIADRMSNVILQIFQELNYAQVTDSDDIVKVWLSQHNSPVGFLMDGCLEQPNERELKGIINPCTKIELAKVFLGKEEDIETAISIARRAQEEWCSQPKKRSRILYSIARNIQKHQRLITLVENITSCKPGHQVRDVDIPYLIRNLYHFAGWPLISTNLDDCWKPFEVTGIMIHKDLNSLSIIPWRMVEALAVGSSVVVLASPECYLSALLFAEVCISAGLPPGLLNVIASDELGFEKLSSSPNIEKLVFIGSTQMAKSIRKVSAGCGKDLSLHLCSRPVVIVFDSADQDSAIEGVIETMIINNGKTGVKVLLQESIFNKFHSKLKDRFKRLRVGSCMDKNVDSTLVTETASKEYLIKLVDAAQLEGAEIFQVHPVGDSGFPPTLISNVQTSSILTIKEFVPGPILILLPFRTPKEAIALANNSLSGLSASVWTEKISLALEVSRYLKVGTVWINSQNMLDAAAGFGGCRESGYSRTGGMEGLMEFMKPNWQISFNNGGQVDQKFGQASINKDLLPSFQPDETTFKLGVDHTYKLYYGGAQKRPDGNSSRAVYNSKGKVIAYVPDAGKKDVRNAVEASLKGQPSWEKRPGHSRAQILYYIAENMEQRKNAFVAQLEEMSGKTEEECLQEVDQCVSSLFTFASCCDKFGGTVQETQLYGMVITSQEAVGIIGIICPEECPLLAFVTLVASAIARGNSVIVVPNEKQPLAALDMYQVFDTSDVPPGVINILTGSQDHLARCLAEHQDIQSIWYYGCSPDGAAVVEHASSQNFKRTWVGSINMQMWYKPSEICVKLMKEACHNKTLWIPMGEIFAN
ncbi:aldehyde dehydrogenase family 16 member A1-like [Limulus polyphemus]|uniref:Aldehyde dehydrogenase family 16 member A1-like n=1 Tax=Limulus polyphemus TaxID=6850 RepID=A0ABM1BLG0_LIMPO|nr:aldehyde dehydrogenase family 16 member A1-like [Limulus polyphemus]